MSRWLAQIRLAVRSLFRRPQADRELDEELQYHLERQIEENLDRGLAPEEARYTAMREMGAIAKSKEECRDARGVHFIETLAQDVRYALRSLARNRAFAAVATVTLGLGIGASTAIFSVIDNVLLEPFPFKDWTRMVFPQIHGTTQAPEQGRQGYTSDEFLEFARQNHVFDAVVGASEDAVLYKHGEGVDSLFGADVTPGAFEFFGMQALYGRILQPEDYRPGAQPVFVMRYKTWKERFSGDPGVLNKTFVLNGEARTLVGIMPPRFGWYGADLWIPKTPLPGESAYWFMLGRLKAGVSRAQAAADITVITDHLAKINPQGYPAHFQVSIKQMGDAVVGQFASTLYTVLAAVGLLLLIACANVANLMLARATSREKEFALRAVLGAGRARLVRLLLAESLGLAVGGATLGLLIAWSGLKLIVATMPPDLIPSESVIGLNPTVLAFALVLAVLTPLIFGLAPALQAARRDLNDPLRESGRGVSSGFRTGRMRDAVAIAEVAVSLTLLVGAGLLMRSFVALREVNLGLRADHVFETILLLPPDRYTTAQVSRFFPPLLARVKALPGVVDAAESSALPPNGGNDSKIEVSGKPPDREWHAQVQNVSEGYFRVLRIPFGMGRPFSETEINEARKIAVVNQTFVSTYLRGEDPIGRRVKLVQLESGTDTVRDPWFEIVGVVTDVANQGPPQYGGGGLRAPSEPGVWVPYTVTGGSGMQTLLVRSKQTPMALMHDVQQAVWATDSGVALVYPDALEHFISQQLYAGPRFALVLMVIFGCVGLILVTVGIYSVLSYATTRKTHEIGIRIALGAERPDVLHLVIGPGLRLVTAGVAIGVIVILLLGRVIEAELWRGVKPYDPATMAGAAVVLSVVSMAACYIPARRAMRVDPMVALRYE